MGVSERLEKSREILTQIDDIRLCLQELEQLYALHHSILYLCEKVTPPLPLPYIRTTIPEEWVGRYLSRGYSSIDPIVRVLIENEAAIDWKDIVMSDREKEFMREAVANGVGLNGYSLPHRDENQRLSMYSITSNLGGREWSAFLDDRRGELQIVGELLHHKAFAGRQEVQAETSLLSKREIEALTLSAQGKGYHGIAVTLDISEHTARDYLKKARIKLECRSLPQAVAKAVQLRLISV